MRRSAVAAALVVAVVAGGLAWAASRPQVVDPDAGRPVVAADPEALGEQAVAVVRAWERAVARRDPAAAAALASDDAAAARLRALVRAARETDVRFTARYVAADTPVSADGTWTGAVQVTWAFDGFDASPARQEIGVRFVRGADGRVGIARVGVDGPAPLWLSGPVRVERTSTALVVVADGAPAEAYDVLARRAVPVVQRVVSGWDGRLVVEVPNSAAALDRVLGTPRGSYAGIAAVTVSADGEARVDAPVHVFVNPDQFARLRERGAQVVMSHEAVHAATAADVSRAPDWLVEGFADYVALRDVDLPLSVTAAQAAEEVRRHGLPQSLPTPAELDAGASHLGATYELSWLACTTLAGAAGEQALVDVYDDTSAGVPLATALREHAALGVGELTRRWRQRLAALPGR